MYASFKICRLHVDMFETKLQPYNLDSSSEANIQV